MAFDFLGTFNKSQMDRALTFVRSQLPLVNARLAHLAAEQMRIGTLVFTYDTGGVPIGCKADSNTSYMGKLLNAYQALGGDPFYDLNLRQMAQVLTPLQGTVDGMPQMMTNGEIIAQPGLADAPSAEYMRSALAWVGESIHYRFENLERKIRRTLDYSDQLGQEIVLLNTIISDNTVDGSLENIYASLTDLMTDGLYRAITDDKGNDLQGKLTMAPFASYEQGPDSLPGGASSTQRQQTGSGQVVQAGQSVTEK